MGAVAPETVDILHVLVQGGGAPTVAPLHLHAGVVGPARVDERELATFVLHRPQVIGVAPTVRITGGGAGHNDCCCLLGTDSVHVTAAVSSLCTIVITPTIFVRSSSTSSFTAPR